MSANLIVFSSNNTLSAVGNFRIISYTAGFYNVQSIAGITDSISGETTAAIVQRAFRWSKDGNQYSLWTEFTKADQSPLTSLTLGIKDGLFIEFKYTVINDPGNSPELQEGDQISPVIVINSFDLLLTHGPVDPYAGITRPAHSLCSDEFTTMRVLRQEKFTFNPYAVNNGIRLYKDLSLMVNLTFGWDVQYFKVNPQVRSKDVILREWTLFNVEDQKCFKILVPNNEFPDSKPQYNQFGIDFEIPFEVHIDRTYWENNFGLNTMPQKRDIIYFPQTNRIYEVQSSYIYRDFMFNPLYFKVAIVKYMPKADQFLSDQAANTLNSLTLSTEELFGAETRDEIKKITKPEQYVTITATDDPTRAQVNRLLPITRYDFYNNYTLLSEHYYNLASLYQTTSGTNAVVYRAQGVVGPTDNRSFVCWLSPQPNPIQSSLQSTLRPLLRGKNTLGNGMDIDLVYSPNVGQSQILITMNSTVTQFVLTNVKLDIDKWYAFVVNVSNEFGQASVDVHQQRPQADNTTELMRLYHKVQPMISTPVDSGEGFKLYSSSLLMTNIRLFDHLMEEEKQSVVLNQLVVKDSNKALIIDNARPLLRLPFVTNPK